MCLAILLDELRLESLINDKKIKESINYTKKFIHESVHAGELRSYATERNNTWKYDAKVFTKENTSKTIAGKLNNNFYRRKFQYDVVVPSVVYSSLLDYYLYSLENKVKEDVEFMEKYFDHLMMFSQAIFYYKDKYPSRIKSKRDMTPMYVRLIYSMIGREYRKVLSFMQKIDLLHIDTMYVPSSLDYKTKTQRKGICRHYNFVKELDGESVIYQIRNRVIITKAYDMDNKLDAEIDYAETASNVVKSKELNKYFSDNFKLSDKCKENRKVDYDGFTYYYSRINEEGDLFSNFSIGRDKWGHRLYHPFLNINKNLRSYTLIDNSSDTTVVDINNSHPYLFSLLFEDNFLNYVQDLLTDDEIRLFRSVASDPIFEEKLSVFNKITSSGTYYSFLEDNIKSDWSIKKINMHYFYGNFNKRNLLYKFFAKNFNFINVVKYRMIKMADYKRICQILQQIEARIIIDEVFMGLMKDNYKVMPLHDAIMCLKKDEKEVRARMTAVFNKIGVKNLPKFDKTINYKDVKQTVDNIKIKNGNIFLNKGILFEELNIIIKHVGIKNRVFKEDMKKEAIEYIDKKFEERRESIDDDIAETYYELREKFDNKKYDTEDYTDLLIDYRDTLMVKRKFYARDVISFIKVNPVEYFNSVYGTKLKTRLKENNYIY